MANKNIDQAVQEAIHDYKISRYKNPYFWVGVIGVALVAMGIEPESLTSWTIVAEKAVEFINNPVAIGGVVLAMLGIFVDPTSKGVTDK